MDRISSTLNRRPLQPLRAVSEKKYESELCISYTLEDPHVLLSYLGQAVYKSNNLDRIKYIPMSLALTL